MGIERGASSPGGAREGIEGEGDQARVMETGGGGWALEPAQWEGHQMGLGQLVRLLGSLSFPKSSLS